MKIISHESFFFTLVLTFLIVLCCVSNQRKLTTDAFHSATVTFIQKRSTGTYCDRRSHVTSAYLIKLSKNQVNISHKISSNHDNQMDESIDLIVSVMEPINIGSRLLIRTLVLAMATLIITTTSYTLEASAVDFIGPDISQQNLSNGNYEHRDFSGITAIGTDFQKSNLQGCNFNKANLMDANLSGADISGATFQGSILDGAILKDVNAIKTIFSESILDVGTFENADLTDSLWPSKLQIMICDMSELKGTSSNGINTRDSILCPL
jgi:uncharacterized protein YjbI with pentapeptide repeats